jgi:hypothetical protein
MLARQGLRNPGSSSHRWKRPTERFLAGASTLFVLRGVEYLGSTNPGRGRVVTVDSMAEGEVVDVSILIRL